MRILYPDAKASNICAMIYVFDESQQMSECCGCAVSHDGLVTLSYTDDLLANPLTGLKSTAGTVMLVSADQASNPTCDATTVTPTGAHSLVSPPSRHQAQAHIPSRTLHPPLH